MNGFKSGFISLAGRPNVGKSTLMNALIGEKLSIVSHKPQTTRNRVRGALTRPGSQIVFVDTPGLHAPKHKLGELMVKSARQAMSDADAGLLLVSARDGLTAEDAGIISGLKRRKTPVFLVINKTDAASKTAILSITDKANALFPFTETVPVSALKGENLELLTALIEKVLPEGPKFFPDDFITDQPERFIAAEMIREKLLNNLRDEAPHGTAVEIFSVKKRENRELTDIEANIYCEKDSHKGIIIGKNGEMLKRIGSEARRELERFFGMPVNLQLWVKVKKDWRDNAQLARTLGSFNTES